MVDELTEVENPQNDETTEKKKRGRKPGSSSKRDKISYEEAQQKLCRVFNGVCSILKLNKRYTEKDFEEEAKDLERMANKYDFIHIVLTLLDPLFFVLGLFDKAGQIFSEKKQREHEKQVKEEGGTNQ